MTTAVSLLNRPHRWPIIASYTTVIGMVVSFAAALIRFQSWLFPGMDSSNLLVVCAVATIETFFSYWLLRRSPTAQRQVGWYRATEVLIILLVVKVFTELRQGPFGLLDNFALWPVQFPLNILNGRYLFTILPVLLSWYIGNLFAIDLFLLGVDDPSSLDDRSKMTPVRSLILRRFLNVGMIVVVLAAIPPQIIFDISLPAASNTVPAVLAYFFFGVVLLSLTRYVTLETTWLQERLQIPAQIPRRWFAYSTLILLILVILIQILPTNFGMGLLVTIDALFQIIYLAFMAIYGLIMLGFGLLAQLFIRTPTAAVEPLLSVTPPPQTLPSGTANLFNWQLLESFLLWGTLFILVIIALRQYIAFHKDLAYELQGFRPFRWFKIALNRLLASLKKANETVGTFIQKSLRSLRNSESSSISTSEWDFINPRRLSPRQKVIFYYLALVRRAGEAGLPRKDGQTPYEYSRSLVANLNEEKDSLAGLTESFIEARYSQHEIPLLTAFQAESIWVYLRKALRNVRKSRQEAKKP